MRVTFILPAPLEARQAGRRSIKYHLFPPLGLALLAAYLDPGDEAAVFDEHVGMVPPADDCPDAVAIEVYVTCARRAYSMADAYRARGVHVVLGGLHVTACPAEALGHADTIVRGPAEEAWPRFVRDFRRGCPAREYVSSERTLGGLPFPRRDLIDRRRYLVPNSLVVSRGCPHSCDFCYSDSFFRGGPSFYTCAVDRALAEVESLPGRHLFFLDDNIMGSPRFCRDLFREMVPLRRVWQGAATVAALRDRNLVSLAAESGLRSLFIGFESLSRDSLLRHGKSHNGPDRYDDVIRSLHDSGVMINASFVFGLEGDGPDVFDATTDWALSRGIETATFHILTPYPGTALHARLRAEGRILTDDLDLYDTRHAVFRHPVLSPSELEEGYARAYRRFYSWRGILSSAMRQETVRGRLRHLAYTGAWRRCDPLWRLAIALKQLTPARPILESVLAGGAVSGAAGSGPAAAAAADAEIG